MGATSIDTFGCFGKLPVSREFLVEGSRVLSESRFDRWVGEGIGLSKARLGPRYDEKVTTFAACRFLWSGGTGTTLLAGELKPSEDGAGRRHPMSAFACVDHRQAADSGSLKPLIFEAACAVASDLVTRARATETPVDALNIVRSGRAAADSTADARAAYQRFVESRKIAEFFDASTSGEPLRYQVMQAFQETIDHFRSRNPKDIRVGLRCPVTSGDDRAAAFEAAFWVDLIAKRMRKPLDGYNCFRSRPENGGPADFHFFFSEPSGTQFTSLIDRDVDIESVSCLDRPYGGDPKARMESGLKGLLESREAGLGDLLKWAGG